MNNIGFFLYDSMVVGIEGAIGTSECGSSEFLKATYHAIMWFHDFFLNNKKKKRIN